jgi:LysM repeat protein
MKNCCLKLALFIIFGTTFLSLFPQKALAKDSYGLTWTVTATPSAVAIDLSNNIYYAGYLASGSAVELNPTPTHLPNDIKTATTGAIFLTKLNSDLTYNASYIIEADNPTIVSDKNISVALIKVATDSAQNVYLLGSFNGNVDFDPTAGMDFHSSNNEAWSFLMKINSDGTYTYGNTYLWQSGNVTIRDMVIKNDNIYLLGQAINNGASPITINLDPLGASDMQTLNAGDTLGFYTKLTGGTVYDYSRTIKNTASQYLEMDHLAIDSTENVFLYGVFNATTQMNFDGSGGTDNKTSSNSSNDLFLSKYDSTGTYVLTYVIGGIGNESAQALGIDNHDNVFYSGGFNDIVDFDPTGTTDNQTASLPDQRFLSKLNANGTYGYALIWNSNSLIFNKVIFDNNNLTYLVGTSAGPVNCDPIGATDSIAGFGLNDAFLTVLNPDKTYNYTYVWGGAENEKAMDAAFDSLNDFYVAGSTESLSVNFDPTGQSSIMTTFTGGENGYLTEFSSVQLTITPTPAPSNNSNNSSASVPGPVTCTNPIPVAPRIFQIAATKDKSTLHFVPSADPQDSYTINYGLYSDAEMYNVTFNYSDKSGAIPYTINALAANTTYYYKVRANNGCMPGVWSNTLGLKTASATAGGNIVFAPSNTTANNNTSAVSTGLSGSCSQYTVMPGDSLWKIAQKVLGAGNKYLQVWNTNKGKFPTLNSSSIIRSGWTLSVGC